MNYKMIVLYDGTRYEGWQRQKRTAETIQGKLEKAIADVTGEDVQVIGAGRTDAGVHALAQTANFHLEKPRDVSFLAEEINRHLPDDISVYTVTEAEERFHSRFHASAKMYRYRIRTAAAKNVFARRFVWQYGKKLDTGAMRRAAEDFIGTHDFTSFCGNKNMKKSAVRRVDAVTVEEAGGETVLTFRGEGFLQNMIRIMTGTLVEIGEGKRAADSIPEILAARNRAAAGFTAPPQGLCLVEVVY